MWRRFSASSAETNAPGVVPTTPSAKNPPPAPPSTPVTATPKSATSLAQAQTVPSGSGSGANGSLAKPVKQHDLPSEKPKGWGGRRRSSLLEKLTRETTKEGTSSLLL